DWQKRQVIVKFSKLKLVRTIDGKFRTGKSCYFACEGIEHEDSLPSVDVAVYSSGRSKAQQENAKKFLEIVGVSEIGEAELGEALLATRYNDEDFSPKKSDMKRFVSLLENNPGKAAIFNKYYIFDRSDGKWGTPSQVYLDEPFIETALSSFFGIYNEDTMCSLSSYYLNCGVSVKI